MKLRIPLAIPLAILAAGCSSASVSSSNVDAAVIRTLQRGESAFAIVEFHGELPYAEVTREYRHLPFAAITLRSFDDLTDVVSQGQVVRVYHDMELYTEDIDDGLALIGQPAAAAAGFDGTGGAVAVLDTGAHHDRADFGSCAGAGADCRIVESIDVAPDDGLADGPSQHGTNVAGIVAAVAPGVDIVALDVFDGEVASSRDVIAAIDWAIANRDAYGIRSLNLSLGTEERFAEACDDIVFAPAIEAALDAGIVTVTSTGNAGDPTAISAPACVTAAVAVAAVHGAPYTGATTTCTDLDAPADAVTCFSNTSAQVDLLAPGSRVDAGGITMSGTSQASPHVAAAVAMFAADRDAPHWIDVLERSGADVRDHRSGLVFPRLDLAAAADEAIPPVDPPDAGGADPTPPPTDPPAPSMPTDEPWVLINGGASTTASADVTLTIFAPRPSLICVSNTTSCRDFVEFTAEMPWTLGDADPSGDHHVYVFFPDPQNGLFRAVVASDAIRRE